MKIKTYIFVVLVLFMFAVTQTRADSISNREYQIKAAFLYNFIMFVDWPAEKLSENNEPIAIGVIGKDPFENAFEPIKDKHAKDRKVIIKHFKGLEELKKSGQEQMNKELEDIRKCHLLFICNSEKPALKEIINLVKEYNILTVGDMDGFLESGGGIINFVVEEGKIRFEINAVAASASKLDIRSQLLRLAKKVIEDRQTQDANKGRYEFIAKYDN